MAFQPVPSYRFEFLHGISSVGVVERLSSGIDGGTVHRIKYWLDDLPLTASLGRPMPAIVADLIDVSVAVYVADRLARREADRDSRQPADRWHRRMHVVVPVRNPERWRHPEAITLLQVMLSFLTDDVWTFEFVAQSCSPRSAEVQLAYLQPPDGKVAVALHSGGLDSLLGLAALVTNGNATTVVPVTVVTNRRTRQTVESVTAEIRHALAVTEPRLLPTLLRVGISGIGRDRDDREPTQRTRGMIFLATGVAVAAMAGVNRLQVCENGIGAISLPMTSDHWGARATRAMHPRTLMLMSQLAAITLDRSISIQNPGLFNTKGELVGAVDIGRFMLAARQTASCDHVSYIRRGEACGCCTSCLLRRVALTAAGLDAVVDGHAVKYRTDWFDSDANWSSVNITHLVAMRHQVDRLREVTAGNREFSALDAAFPELFDVVAVAPTLGLAKDEVERCLLRLYETYVREFDTFVARIDRVGWGRRASVTELMTTSEKASAG